MKHWIIPVLSVAFVTLLWLNGPIPQDQGYHHFADQREVGGIPNFMDVITNLPFLFVGATGLSALRFTRPRSMRRMMVVLSTAFILLTFGSGYYHWEPRDITLVYDRVPIAIIILTFFCMIINDHVGEWYGHMLLPLLVLLGIGSVLWWHWSGDLRPYVLVHYLPILLIPLIIWAYPYRHGRWSEILLAYLFFALARAAEALDHVIFQLFRAISPAIPSSTCSWPLRDG